MHLNEDHYKAIEEMAALFFKPEDIADNLEFQENDKDEFCMNIELKTGDAYLYYRRGRLRTEVELRNSIKMAAMNGSSPAQTMMLNFYKESL